MIDSDVQKLVNDKGWQRGWKVVGFDRIDDVGHYISVVATRSFGRVKYACHAMTVPGRNMGPLAVFKNRASARDFGRAYTCEIHPCIYKPSEETSLWDGFSAKGLGLCPEGTALADAVMLLPQRVSKE